MLDNPSNIRLLGLGFVAENKKRNTNTVHVWPVEIVPDLKDDLTTATKTTEVTGVDCKGTPYRVSIEQTMTIPCEWYGDTNRATSPDVRRGERVLIYQIGDSEKYYWASLGQDDHLRRKERIIFTINDMPNNADTDPDDTNTWTVELNTFEGHITIRTTMSDNEKAAWVIQIDGADGKYIVEDHKGNHSFIDSVENHIQLKNANDSMFELNKENITAICNETFRLKCKSAIFETETTKWTNGQSWDLSTDTYTVKAGSTAELKAGSTVTIAGSVIKLN